MKKQKLYISIAVMCAVLLLGGAGGSAAWKQTGAGRKYTTSSGKYVKSRWMKIKKKWYYFDKRGNLKTGRFKVGDDWYYATRSAGRICNRRVGSYYYGKDGRMVCNTWKKSGKYWFYYDQKGKRRFGKVKTAEGICYCDRETGKVISRWVNKTYYGKDGVMVTSQWIDESYVNEKGTITRGNKNPKNPPTQEEIRWLSAITYLEAGNQSYYGKKCVASVVMNRVNSKKFPNTIKGVLFQSGQFTPADNGTLSSLYYSRKAIQAQCVKAAKYVLEHGSVLKGYYYFNTFSGTLKIGEHYFG